MTGSRLRQTHLKLAARIEAVFASGVSPYSYLRIGERMWV